MSSSYLRLAAPVSFLAVMLVILLSASAWAEPRIVAGDTVPITDHPYQAEVTLAGGFLCGGSIRDATHVVIAAHCVVDEERASFPFIVPPGEVTVGYGNADRFQLDTVAVARVSVSQATFAVRTRPSQTSRC